MKITDMIVSALIKKGVLYEARNCDMDIEIPVNDTTVVIRFKADNMSLKIEKE